MTGCSACTAGGRLQGLDKQLRVGLVAKQQAPPRAIRRRHVYAKVHGGLG